MEGFRAGAERIPEGVQARRGEHELLDVENVVGVGATVDHVQERHGQDRGVGATDISEEGESGGVAPHLAAGEGNAEQRVGAEVALVGAAIGLDERVVDLRPGR